MKGNHSEIDDYLNDMNFSRERVLRSIFNKYYRPLCQYAHKFIPDDDDLINDLVTEVFIGLINKLVMFNSAEDISNYLYNSTRKRCIDHLRKKDSGNKNIVELMNALSIENEDVAMEAELMQVINEEFHKLPSQRKKILHQLFWEGLTSEQVALKMRLSIRTVLNQKVRAILSLRKNLLKKIL